MNSTATAVVFEKPGVMTLRSVGLVDPAEGDCVVEVLWSGISTGTERLLWDGRMPAFPGLAYPLVPGYESVGRVVEAGPEANLQVGDLVFVPGSPGFKDVRGLFGASADRLVVDAARLVPIDESLGEEGILLALTATAYHAVTRLGLDRLPQLIVGHGVLGRLMARCVIALGGEAPTVWESNPQRFAGAEGYTVCLPDDDARRDYATVTDVSGDASIVDALVSRLAPGGQIILAGFYHAPVSFTFPPAFQREAGIAIAAEWRRPDLDASLALIRDQRLALGGLITHHQSVRAAAPAYRTAFGDPDCLKMVLDWRCMH
ncbi:MAG: chlorophyll synthesis pathway protein BchC [Halieaceae bacterium]|jgi:3-hydroxyethyl bacteriochlorophyllide a dehydrogenase|nr:chlorophyll synthesis pathway protein BchC [Halieaceae bacterium]